MEKIFYLVTKIQGDYAILMEEGNPQGPENPVALAFLPDSTGPGTRLVWENLEYTLTE